MNARSRSGSLLHFVVVTFGFSWTLWALMILSQRGALPFTVPTHWIGSFGPTLGALVAAWAADGRQGLRALGRRLVQWRTGVSTYLFAVLLIVGLDGATLAALALLDGRVPALAPFTRWGTLALHGPIILVIGGPLGEELGWRGYLQPHLEERIGRFRASCVVGLVWAAWHLPLPWLQGAAQEGSSRLTFTLMVLPMAVFFAWLLDRSGGSLLPPLLLHTTINTVSYVVEPEVLGPLKDRPETTWCFIAVSWLAAAVLVTASRASFFDRPGAGPDAALAGRAP